MAHYICEKCGKGFRRDRMGSRNTRFCSQDCYHAWRKENRITTGQFCKGIVPWNKGKKGTHFSPGTEFKSGSIPATKRVIGTVRVRSCKGNKKRAFIKTADPNVWRLRCYVVWEKRYGSVPKGLLIHHIDRNTLNDNLTNLSLRSRASHINEHRSEFEDKRKAAAAVAQEKRWADYSEKMRSQKV